MSSPSPRAAWPALPYRDWEPTKQTLHRYCQIVGKVRMALVPPRNHWWHVTLYVTATGLSTGPMPYGDRDVEIAFDLLRHRLVVATSDGQERELDLRARPACADVYAELFAMLRDLGVDVASRAAVRPRAETRPQRGPRARDVRPGGRGALLVGAGGDAARPVRLLRALHRARPARSTSSGTRSTSRTPASRAGARRWATWTR